MQAGGQGFESPCLHHETDRRRRAPRMAASLLLMLGLAMPGIDVSAVEAWPPRFPVKPPAPQRAEALRTVDQPPGRVRRTVLALHNGAPGRPSHISQLVEMPLNYLGLVVRERHVAAGPPPTAWLADVRAVVTWFEHGAPAPDWVVPWLTEVVPARVPFVVHLGSLQPLRDADRRAFDAWMAARGLAWEDTFASGAARVNVDVLVERSLCAFEGKPERDARHEGPRSISASHTPWIRTTVRGGDGPSCTPVLVAPWGGLALQPWIVRLGGRHDERRLYLNLFAFLRRALRMERVPAPQPAVRCGRRLFFFHVDGDGFESVSWIDNRKRSAEVFRKEIVERFQLPCTLSVIVASLTDTLEPEQSTRLMQIAKDLFALPYVEVASHGVIHPFEWAAVFGDEPDVRKKFAYPGLKSFAYSPVAEVRDSITFIRKHLLPTGKDCVGMLWTGDCVPPADAIEEAGRLGCWNLNGGTFRWDSSFDSIAFVSPWTRRLDGQTQVYAAAANDNEFPGFYDTNPTAFEGVNETIARTGSPRILKPANVYAHFYSAERRPRLKALQALLMRWGVKAPTFPTHASVYVRAVQDALHARVERTESGWRLTDFGTCRTARIDDEPRTVDLRASTGLLGFRRTGRSLHLHLDGPEADVVLHEGAPGRPWLVEANCEVTDFDAKDARVSLRCQAFVPRTLTLAGLPPHRDASLSVDGAHRIVRTDGEGQVTLALAPGGPSAVELQVR